MAVNLTNLTANVNNIQGLSDRPNITDGITSQHLKELFDKAGADIKTYVNGTLIPELEAQLNQMVTDAYTKSEIDAQMATVNNSITNIENNYQPKITSVTSDQSGGNNGDIYLKYSS